MNMIVQLLAIIAIVTGTFFSVVGVLGYVRLPDAYSRLHATGKVGVYGVVLLLAAATLITPLGPGRALALIIFLLLTGPVTTHTIASAAYRLKLPVEQAIRDDLARSQAVGDLDDKMEAG